MYNLAKSLALSAKNYLSGVLTGGTQKKRNINQEYTRDEISNYFSNHEWKSGYMNGYYYGYMPPDDDLAVQLTLICRLIHHRFVSFGYEAGELLTPKYLPIDKRVILYKSDLELLDPRNLEETTKYKNSSMYKWFCRIVDEFDWDTKLRIPTQNPIKQIRIIGDWSIYQDINLELQIDDSGNPINPTIQDICKTVFPVIAHTWVCQRKIQEYSVNWMISATEPDVLELGFDVGYHIDNVRYPKGCYDETDN